MPDCTFPLITSLPDENALSERGQLITRAGQGFAHAPLLPSHVPGAAHADVHDHLNVVRRSDRKVADCAPARSGQHGDRRAGGARIPCLARALSPYRHGRAQECALDLFSPQRDRVLSRAWARPQRGGRGVLRPEPRPAASRPAASLTVAGGPAPTRGPRRARAAARAPSAQHQTASPRTPRQ